MSKVHRFVFVYNMMYTRHTNIQRLLQWMTVVYSGTAFISVDISFDSGDNASLVSAFHFSFFSHLIPHNLEKIKLTDYNYLEGSFQMEAHNSFYFL